MDGSGSFGVLLQACRRTAGLTQQELAERSGLSIKTIGNLEHGRARWPYRDSVRRLADALGLSASARDEFIAAAVRRPPPDPPPALPDEPGGQRGPGPVTPRQIPAAVPGFTGRFEQLAAMSHVLGEPGGSASIAVISGIAGVGKTALAIRWGHQAAGQFPGGQLFVNLRGFDPAAAPMLPADALRGFVEALGVPPGQVPHSLDGMTGLYRSLLAGQRVLVILDNARDPAQVRPLLPGSPACRVVITSRSQLSGLVALDGATRLTLDAMNQAEASELLTRRLGTERAGRDAPAVEQVAESCGRLPIALCITAARAAMQPDLPMAQVAAGLVTARGRLDEFTVAGDPEADVRAAFSWSYERLNADSQRVFRLIGLHPGPDLSAGAAASLAGSPPGQTGRILADLTESSLLSMAEHGRYSQHDLLRVYAAEQASAQDGAAERQPAIRRMLDHYLTTCRDAASLIDGNWLPMDLPPAAGGVYPEELTSRSQALDWYAREYAGLLRLVDLAAATGFDVHAWQLPRAMRALFDFWALWRDWDHTHRVGAAAAVRLGDGRAQALTYLAWARCDTYQGRSAHAEEHLRQAHDLFEETGDRLGQARALVSLGVAASGARRYELAISWVQRAQLLYADIGDLDGQAGSLANLGLYQTRLGSFAAARDLLTGARDMFAELGNRAGEALAAANLGLACQGLGDYQQAIACHLAAVGLLEELGDLAGQAEVLGDLADAYLGDGQHEEAVKACAEALEILTRLGHPNTARTRARLAELQAKTGE